MSYGISQTGEPGGFRTLVQLGSPDGVMLRTTVSSGGTERQGFLYAPPAEEVLGYDTRGNLIKDARWEYTWDGNNRLVDLYEIPMATMAGGNASLEGQFPRRMIRLAYDHLGRRIAKTVWVWLPGGNGWRLEKDLRYVYDGWQMIAELDHTFAPPTAGWQPTRTWGVFDLYGPEQRQAVQKGFGGFTGISGVAAERSVVRTYLWGQDLSGTMTGAGGVGGLLSVTHQGVTYHTCSDANGNLTGLLAANGADAGQLIARFDYDPFGNRLTNTGPDVEICPMGFSTKYTDSETGLVDYGLRIYSPPLARFASRDPIEESGGVNLYGFVGNDPVNRVDYLGLWATVVHHQIIDDFLANRGIRGAVECKCCGKIDVADILKRANARMDGITYPGGEPDGNYTPGSPSWEAQHPRNAYQHGMHNNTGFRRQTPQQAEQQFNQFVNQALAGAAQHAIDCADREHESKSGWPCDDIRSGINELGTAIHSLTDSLSPAHEGFQAWPPFNPTLPAIAPIIGSSTANAAANAAAMREHANRENMDAYNNRKQRVQDLMNGRVGQLLKSLLGCCENAYK